MVQPTIDIPAAGADTPALRGLAVAVYSMVQRLRQLHHKDPIDKATLLVLWRVGEHGEPRPSEVAYDLGLDLSTVSRHVRALDQDGYIARTPDPEDGRACRLTVTPKGAELAQQAWERRVAAITAAVQDWPEEDRATLTTLLTRLADSLTDSTRPRTDREDGL
jgi:DNA-binding MarR family transcriptional regulator